MPDRALAYTAGSTPAEIVAASETVAGYVAP